MGNRSTPSAWRAQRTERGHAPLTAPAAVALTLERQLSGDVLDGGVARFLPFGLDDRDRATGSVLVPGEWMPTEATVGTVRVGDRVDDITVSPDGERIYVAGSDSVTVINRWHSIVARIPMREPAKSLVTDVAGTQLFVVHYDGSVVVIDTRDYTAQTAWDGCASDVVISPDGRHLYAAHNEAADDRGSGVISMIDIACATTVATLPVNDVAALAISPDGSRLYAISCDRDIYYQYPAGWLTIIDTASRAVVETIAVGGCPETLTVSPDGAYLYITHYDTCSLSAVNLTTGSVTAIELGDAPLGVVFTPDSAHAYVGNVHSLKVINTTTNEAEHIDTGDLPRGLQLSPDGKQAYIADFGARTLSVVDTITKSIVTTIDVSGYSEAVAVSPDGDRIYVGDYWSGSVEVISMPTVRGLQIGAAS